MSKRVYKEWEDIYPLTLINLRFGGYVAFNAEEDSGFVQSVNNEEVCYELEYVLKFDNEKTEADQVFEDNGVKIVVDKKSFLYLVGTTLEYSGGLNGKGFVFNNPNAARTCGCGESFSL